MSKGYRQTDRVAKALGSDILSGKLASGDALSSDDRLCATHQVSRTVIREALRLLTGKGLIYARPRIGTRVAERQNWALWDGDLLAWAAELDDMEDLLRDGMDMRLAIEPMLAALAASRADEAANQALQEALRQLQGAPTRDNELAYLAAFYKIAANQLALAALPLTKFCLSKRATPPILTGYRALTAAIAQKDAASARQIALQNLLDA